MSTSAVMRSHCKLNCSAAPLNQCCQLSTEAAPRAPSAGLSSCTLAPLAAHDHPSPSASVPGPTECPGPSLSPARALSHDLPVIPIYRSAQVTYILVQCPHRDPVQQMCSAGRHSQGARATRRFPRPRARRNETDNAPLPLLDSLHVRLAPYGVNPTGWISPLLG